MSPTLRDVAQRANVSASTVSRVLNNYPHVDEATREVVWQVAQELGYPLENLRRQQQSAQTVLLLTRFQETQVVSETWAGLKIALVIGAQSLLEQAGITTRVHHSHMHPEEAQTYASDSRLVGMILLGGVCNREFVHNLISLDIPLVAAGAQVHPLQLNCVAADYRGGIEQAVTHLAARRRRRIGLVNGPPTTSSSEEKYAGFRLGLTLNDLEFRANRVLTSDFEPLSGYNQTVQLLDQTPEIDAIVYADDNMAMGGLHALKEQGYRVPDDVAITGFYGYNLARYSDPPITSVCFDMQAMGAVAARRLCMIMNNPGVDDDPWTIILPTTLEIRKST